MTFGERVVFLLTTLALMAGLIISVGETGKLPFDWDDVYAWLGMAADPLPAETLDPNTNAIHFIDIGQGDATLLQSHGEYCLVDAGLPDSKTQLMDYLNRLGVKHIKLLVMSHPHADHIGGMDTVLRNIPVDQVLLPDLSKAPYPTSASFARVMDAIEELNIPTVVSKAGQVFEIGDARLEVLTDGVKTDGYNDLSQVLYFDAGKLTAVLSGDGERAVEKDALEKGVVPHAQVFKAGHHGSNTSNSKNFVQAILPRYVVISCGLDNSYGHPHKEPMKNFQEVGAQILRTDLDGSVVIAEVDGALQSYTSKGFEEAA